MQAVSGLVPLQRYCNTRHCTLHAYPHTAHLHISGTAPPPHHCPACSPTPRALAFLLHPSYLYPAFICLFSSFFFLWLMLPGKTGGRRRDDDNAACHTAHDAWNPTLLPSRLQTVYLPARSTAAPTMRRVGRARAAAHSRPHCYLFCSVDLSDWTLYFALPLAHKTPFLTTSYC